MAERYRLDGKVVIITGGAQGLGRAYALAMADEGAKLVIADVNGEAAEATAKDIVTQGREALALRVDVSSVEDTRQMAEKTVERFGRIDVLVNNAAILGRIKITRVPFFELDLAEWDRVMAVNLKGTLLCCRAVFPQMRAQRRGKIITVTSTTVFRGAPNYVHYVASKMGIVGLTRSLARELGDYNINVNCIAPGGTIAEDPSDTAAVEQRANRLAKVELPGRCFKRMEYPGDLVGTAVFLASSDSDFITGQTIAVDGGGAML